MGGFIPLTRFSSLGWVNPVHPTPTECKGGYEQNTEPNRGPIL
jgi:hypothetical protein